MAPADGMGAPGKEQPVWFPGSPEYSPASPAYSPTSPVHAPAPPSPTYGTLSPEVNPPGDHSPTSPVQDSPRPYYTPCSPTPEMRPAGVAAGEGHVDAPQTAEDCLIMLDGEPGMSPSLHASFAYYCCALVQQTHSNLCCFPSLGGFIPLMSNADAGLSACRTLSWQP